MDRALCATENRTFLPGFLTNRIRPRQPPSPLKGLRHSDDSPSSLPDTVGVVSVWTRRELKPGTLGSSRVSTKPFPPRVTKFSGSPRTPKWRTPTPRDTPSPPGSKSRKVSSGLESFYAQGGPRRGYLTGEIYRVSDLLLPVTRDTLGVRVFRCPRRVLTSSTSEGGAGGGRDKRVGTPWFTTTASGSPV